MAAEVIGFAPDGEDAQSVRFDGTNAYVCTAEVITFKDPVYFFDLSDLRNITWTDTGTIDGYSTSLIQFGGDYLVGIGFGDRGFLKIEAYAQEEDQVIALAAYEQKASYSSAYKSYFIDRQRQLIGLAMMDADSRISRYVLLHFDGYAFHEICVQGIEMRNYAFVRAFMADGWLYVLTDHYSGIYTQRIS